MLDPTTEPSKSIVLLRNGHLSVGKSSVQSTNTCAFDSLYVIVAAMYADFEAIKNQIDLLEPNCKFSHLVTSMFNKETNIGNKHNSLLRQRNGVLESIFEGTNRIIKFDSGLISVQCSGNVNYIIPRALPVNLYSYIRKKECNRCSKEIVSNRCFVDINIESYEQQSMHDLNSCLIDTLLSEYSSTCACDGLRNVTETEFSNFIMVDLQLKHRIRETTLNAIPKILHILGIKFTLFGCIEFIGDDKEIHDIDDEIGHYVSHIFRANKRWERYDDMLSRVTKSNINANIKAQVLFYVKDK